MSEIQTLQPVQHAQLQPILSPAATFKAGISTLLHLSICSPGPEEVTSRNIFINIRHLKADPLMKH